MNIRLGEKLLADLRAAAAKYDCTYSEIARKALRRARRSGVDLASVEVESTYRGEAIRFDLDTKNQGTGAETFRRALTWYLYSLRAKTLKDAKMIFEWISRCFLQGDASIVRKKRWERRQKATSRFKVFNRNEYKPIRSDRPAQSRLQH